MKTTVILLLGMLIGVIGTILGLGIPNLIERERAAQHISSGRAV